MRTDIHPELAHDPRIIRAGEIISACVHCGFCTAHCPTYQLLGDERDGPRGRIYLIKQMIEMNNATEHTQTHLDRCLTCRACETACPAGVQYGELAHIGKEISKEKTPPPLQKKLLRSFLSFLLPYSDRVAFFFGLGRIFKPLMPKLLGQKIPDRQQVKAWPAPRHDRNMIMLAGCSTAPLTPNTNHASARVLDKLGISVNLEPKAGCCGAVDHHIGYEDKGLSAMRRNIDVWWPSIEKGAEAIVITASACALQIKEYGKLLKDDANYAEKAARVSALTKDISEVLEIEDLSTLDVQTGAKISVHCPCTLQHGQDGAGRVARILNSLGFKTTENKNDHICCGSAGTYSLQQPGISQSLLKNKIKDLSGDKPDIIVTSNIGCQLHLDTGTDKPVHHWIELLDGIDKQP